MLFLRITVPPFRFVLAKGLRVCLFETATLANSRCTPKNSNDGLVISRLNNRELIRTKGFFIVQARVEVFLPKLLKGSPAINLGFDSQEIRAFSTTNRSFSDCPRSFNTGSFLGAVLNSLLGTALSWFPMATRVYLLNRRESFVCFEFNITLS